MMSAEQRTRLCTSLRRRCRDKALREVLVLALRHPDLVNAKFTKSGILMQGPFGSVTSHFTHSDTRSIKNLRANLRGAGIYPADRRDT